MAVAILLQQVPLDGAVWSGAGTVGFAANLNPSSFFFKLDLFDMQSNVHEVCGGSGRQHCVLPFILSCGILGGKLKAQKGTADSRTSARHPADTESQGWKKFI